jgi:hypothetical protein
MRRAPESTTKEIRALRRIPLGTPRLKSASYDDFFRPVSRAAAHRGSAIDARTTRHPGYAVSQQKRKLVEQCFG